MIKAPGWAYLIIEIATVFILAGVEYRLGEKLNEELSREGNLFFDETHLRK